MTKVEHTCFGGLARLWAHHLNPVRSGHMVYRLKSYSDRMVDLSARHYGVGVHDPF